MNVAVLGTGSVGEIIATKLVSQGHAVKMGSRNANNERAAAWVEKAGEGASAGTFAEAAAFAQVVFNCTKGEASLAALRAAGADNLAGKVLLDVANPLDFSKGMPPSLTVCNTDSLAEQIQREFPAAKVVKALSHVSAEVMVDPARVAGGEHHALIAGNDAGAKGEVTELLESFGWSRVLDLGDITASRGIEAYLLLWVRLWGALGTTSFNIELAR